MKHTSVSVHEFDVPASQLWSVLVHPDTYPEWLVGAKDIREVSPDWPQPGSYFKHRVGFGPFVIPDRTTVRELAEPRSLVLLVRARPLLEAIVRFEVTTRGGFCTLRMTETPVHIYKLVAMFARPVIRARNDRSMRHLRQLVDAADAARSR